MAARWPAVDAIFVLQAHEIDIVDIEEVGGAPVGVNILLGQFKAHTRRIGIARLRCR